MRAPPGFTPAWLLLVAASIALPGLGLLQSLSIHREALARQTRHDISTGFGLADPGTAPRENTTEQTRTGKGSLEPLRIRMDRDSFETLYPLECAGPAYRQALQDGEGFSVRTGAFASDLWYAWARYRDSDRTVWYARDRIVAADPVIGGTMVLVIILSLSCMGAAWLALSLLDRGWRKALQGSISWFRSLHGETPPLPRPWDSHGPVGVLLDDMERLRRYEATDYHFLEERHQELLVLLGTMDEGLMVLDNRRTLLRINPFAARLFGLDHHDCLGRPFPELVRSEAVQELLDRCMAGHECPPLEVPVYGTRQLFLKVSACHLPLPEADRYLVLFNDITQMKKLEEVRKEFVANVSHELRTPITAIRGFAETLMDEGDHLDGSHQHFISVIHRQSLRLQSIIEDLLSLSRLEQYGGTIQVEECRARDILEGSAEVCLPGAGRKSSTIQVLGGFFSLRCNRALMEQALVNLVNNAILHCPEGTTVQVEARMEGSHADFLVRDNGTGIPVRDQERIFERFYRVDKARSRDAGGTGLGLAIVRHIAVVHGGSVMLHSTLGEGSVFTVRVPLDGKPEVPDGAVTTRPQPAEGPGPTPQSPPEIPPAG